MSTTLQIILTVSLAIIAIYFIVLTTLTVIAYLRVRGFLRFLENAFKGKIEVCLEHLENITVSLEEVSTTTIHKVDDLTEVIPELKDKLQELVDLLDLVQEKLRSPLLNIVSALKIFSQKVNRWL